MRDYRVLSWYLFFGTLPFLRLLWDLEKPPRPGRWHFANPRPMGRLSHRMYRWGLRVSIERKRNIRQSQLGVLFPLQGNTGANGVPNQVTIPPGYGTIGQFFREYNNSWVTGLLVDGTYNEDTTTWPVTTSKVSVIGPGLPPFATGGPITPGGAIVNITNIPSSANANALSQVLWSTLSMTGAGLISGSTLATKAILNGSNNTVVYFDRVLFYDLSAPVALNSGDDIRAVGCYFKQSASPPARLDMGFLGCTGTLRLVGCNVNFIGGNANPNVWVGFAGYSTGGGTTWWVQDNQINDDDLANTGVDALCDFESSGTLTALHFERNTLFNSKMYHLSVSQSWVRDNTFRSTVNAVVSAADAGMFQIQSKTPNTTPPNAGFALFEGNTFIQDAAITGANYIPCVTMSMRYDGSIQTLAIRRNFFYTNQATTATFAGQTIATILIRSNTAGQTLGYIEVSDNKFGFTTNGGTPHPCISIRNDSGGTLGRFRIHRNTGVGANAASGNDAPATVTGGASNLITFTSTPTMTVFEMFDNDVSDGAFTGTPKLIAGAFTPTRQSIRGNTPREASDTLSVGSPGTYTYTHGTTNLVTLGLPAQGASNVYVTKSAGTISTITLNGQQVANETSPFGVYVYLMTTSDVLVVTSATAVPTIQVVPVKSGV